jgi:Skp family chaperone for outer membrane proteins
VRRAFFLVLSVFLLAGCGGGGGSSQRLSRDEYAAKADAICSKYNKLTNAVGSPKNLAGLAKAFDKALPLLDNAISDLRKLKPPKSEQHTVDAWLAQSQVLKHDLQEMRDQARAKNLKGVQSAYAQASANQKQGNKLAAKLGTKVCSKG